MGVVSKVVELRRHTDAEGDVLTASGVRVAVEIGRSIEGDFDLLIPERGVEVERGGQIGNAVRGVESPHGQVA